MTEHRLQLECIAYFRNHFERYGKGVIIPVVNEATYKNNTFEVCKGASDLILVLPKGVIFCELKTEKGVQSTNQKEFEKAVSNIGYIYKVVRSLDQFKEVVKNY